MQSRHRSKLRLQPDHLPHLSHHQHTAIGIFSTGKLQTAKRIRRARLPCLATVVRHQPTEHARDHSDNLRTRLPRQQIRLASANYTVSESRWEHRFPSVLFEVWLAYINNQK